MVDITLKIDFIFDLSFNIQCNVVVWMWWQWRFKFKLATVGHHTSPVAPSVTYIC